MFKSGKCLGLAVSEDGIAAVEVHVAAGKRSVVRSGQMAFTPAGGLHQGAELTKELRQFIRHSGFSTSRCVIGLSAHWIAARQRTLPMVPASAVRGALAIACEREFASGSEELMMDYSAYPSGEGLGALLAAMPSRVAGPLLEAARSAGLTVQALTCSSLALALADVHPIPPEGRLMLRLRETGGELAHIRPDGVSMIRHFSADLSPAGDYVTHLQRALAPVPLGKAAEIVVWNAAGLDERAVQSCLASVGRQVRPANMAEDFGLADASSLEAGRYGPAAALACLDAQTVRIDFLNSHLREERKSRWGRKAYWAAAVGAALVILAANFALGWRDDLAQIENLQRQEAKLRVPSQEAQRLLDDVTFAGGWFENRPKVLDCLREITTAFPRDGRIWATSLTVREDMAVTLSGKASNEQATLEVMDKLKANPRLTEIKELGIRSGGGAAREVSFSISLKMKEAQ